MIKTKMAIPEMTVVLLVLMFAFFTKMATNPFYTDESYWISTSAYFEDWISLDTKSDSWQINFMTLAGPNLPKYLIAAGRLSGGFQPKDLNKTYNYTANYEANEADGRIPPNDLLLISRIPMTILSVLTGFLMYAFLSKLLNRVFAIIWLIFYIQNLALKQILLMAMSEAPLLFFSFLSLVFIYFGQKYWVSFHQNGQLTVERNKFYICFALAGVSAGLAAASKIHAFSFVMTFGIILLHIIINLTSNLSKKLKVSYFIRIFSLFVFSALLVFIILNPFLYSNPFVGIGRMFGQRIYQMGIQSLQYPGLSSQPLVQRWWSIFYKLLTEYASIRGTTGLFINIILLLPGLFLSIRNIIRNIKMHMPFDLVSLALLYFSIMVLSAMWSPLPWQRYFLFPIFVITLINTVGLTFLGKYLLKIIKIWMDKFPKRHPGGGLQTDI